MTQLPVCVLCAFYYPRAEPHPPDRGQTCLQGRYRIERDIAVLASSYRRLLEQYHLGPEVLEPKAGERHRRGLTGDGDESNRRLPAANLPGASKQPRVSGSRERRIPLTDVADLTGPARTGVVRDPNGDQVGLHSVATVLHEWVGGWHERFFSSQRRPRPTVEAMVRWLIGPRLDLVCDADGGIVEFAAELRGLRARIRMFLDEGRLKPQPMLGVPCPRCKVASQLMLDPEDPDRYRECAGCGQLMTQTEYHAHLRDLVDDYRRSRNVACGQNM